MRLDYFELLNGRPDKDIEEPFQSNGDEHLIKFKPRKKVFQILVDLADEFDYAVYVGNPPYPHVLPIEKKLIMPSLKRCRWNNLLFFSIFIHELSHIVPYESRMGLYDKYEEEIICELTAARFLDSVVLSFFDEKRYKEMKNRLFTESMQYIKRHINKANKTQRPENTIDKNRLKTLLRVSKKRFDYLNIKIASYE